MSFLEWLTGMGLMYFGWLIPLLIGVDLIQKQKVSIFVGVLICLTAIPVEILLYRLYKKFESETKKKEREEKQAREQARIRLENERKERIKTSPIKNLTPLQFEEFTKLYMEVRNYKEVRLTRTSGDFGADVLAIAPDKTKICVQCKMYSKPVGVSAIQEVHSAKSYYHCDRAAVAVTSTGYTKQAIELSERVNVYLFAYDDYSREFMPVNQCARTFLHNKR